MNWGPFANEDENGVAWDSVVGPKRLTCLGAEEPATEWNPDVGEE
jgi:hypothetical protein